MNFDEWMEMNPRSHLTEGEFKEFFEYAKKRYSNFDQVNWESYEDNFERLVRDYLNESMEALLLFREFLEQRKR